MQLLRPIRAVCRAPLADAGFTLIETIVAAALALLVLWPVSNVLLNTQQASTGTIQRADAIQAAQVGLRSMDQQLRNAYEVEFPTSTNNTATANSGSITCTKTNGVQPCNVVDVLTRSVSTSDTATDYEIRFDCTNGTCLQYKCPAAYNTGSSSSCTSSTSGVKTTLIESQISNGTNTSPVFSLCYANTATTGGPCANGALRPSSATVTLDVPAAGTLSTHTQNGDPTTVQLTDTIYMQNLDSNYDS